MLFTLWTEDLDSGVWVIVKDDVVGKGEAYREAARLSNARRCVRPLLKGINPNERYVA